MILAFCVLGAFVVFSGVLAYVHTSRVHRNGQAIRDEVRTCAHAIDTPLFREKPLSFSVHFPQEPIYVVRASGSWR